MWNPDGSESWSITRHLIRNISFFSGPLTLFPINENYMFIYLIVRVLEKKLTWLEFYQLLQGLGYILERELLGYY